MFGEFAYFIIPVAVVLLILGCCLLIRAFDRKCGAKETGRANFVPEIQVYGVGGGAAGADAATSPTAVGAGGGGSVSDGQPMLSVVNTCIIDDETLLAAARDIPFARRDELEKLVGRELIRASDLQFQQAQQIFGRRLTVKYSNLMKNIRQAHESVPNCWKITLGPDKPRLTSGERWILKHILLAHLQRLFEESEFETNPELQSKLETIPLACPFVFFSYPNGRGQVPTEPLPQLPNDTGSLIVRNWLRDNVETPPPKYLHLFRPRMSTCSSHSGSSGRSSSKIPPSYETCTTTGNNANRKSEINEITET